MDLKPQTTAAKEKTIGIAGTALGIFPLAIPALDWIGRGQTLMSLGPYIRYLGNPLVQLLEVCGAVALLIWATRLEQARENDATPRIIRPYGTREPEKPTRHWFWVRIAGILAVVAVIFIAVSALSHRLPSRKSKSVATNLPRANNSIPAPSMKPDSPSIARRPLVTPKAKAPDTAHISKQASQPSTDMTHPQQFDKPPPVLELPKLAPSKPMNQSAVIYTAKIDNQLVNGSDKSPGTLYIALRVDSASKYLGNIKQSDVDTIKATLMKTGKVTVFADGPFTINGNGLVYSVSLTPEHARTIYYFANSLESSCSAIKTAIETIIGGQMECKFVMIEASKDPLEPSVMHDFLMASGIDMEIVL